MEGRESVRCFISHTNTSRFHSTRQEAAPLCRSMSRTARCYTSMLMGQPLPAQRPRNSKDTRLVLALTDTKILRMLQKPRLQSLMRDAGIDVCRSIDQIVERIVEWHCEQQDFKTRGPAGRHWPPQAEENAELQVAAGSSGPSSGGRAHLGGRTVRRTRRSHHWRGPAQRAQRKRVAAGDKAASRGRERCSPHDRLGSSAEMVGEVFWLCFVDFLGQIGLKEG